MRVTAFSTIGFFSLGGVIRNASDIVAFILLFSFTIFIHELGHFLVAWRLGLKIETFSIGFGPALWKRTWRGVVYKIGAIPFGGYVSLPQLDPAAMAAIQGPTQAGAADAGEALAPLPPWKKIAVSLAGAVGNLLLAVVFAWIIYLSPAPGARPDPLIVGHVTPDSVAQQQGIRPGDLILKVNGRAVQSWDEFLVEGALAGGKAPDVRLTIRAGADGAVREVRLPRSATELGLQMVEGVAKRAPCVVMTVEDTGAAAAAGVRAGDVMRAVDGVAVGGTQHFIDLIAPRGGETVRLMLERDGQPLEVAVVPRFDAAMNRARIGLSIASPDDKVMPWMQHKEPLAQLKGDASGIFRILRALVTPSESRQAAQSLGGPVMILATLWLAIKESYLAAIGFLRLLNVNLAIINLLPIPVLDGGHIVFALLSAITRRRVPARLINGLTNAFAALIILAAILLVAQDVPRVRRLWSYLRPARPPAESVTNAPPPALPSEPSSVPAPAPVP